MATILTFKAKVKDIKRINNSINNNPNFKLHLDLLKYKNIDLKNTLLNFKVTTMNDYSINYAMGSFLIGKTLTLKIKFNKKSCKVINFTAA